MRAMAKVFVLAWFCLVGLLAFSGRALAAEPVKIGILGLDNYQAVAFTQLFNTPQEAEELQGVRVVVAWPGTVSEEIPESVQRLPEWTKAMEQFQVAIVDSVDACLARCDAVLVMPLDGRRHRSLAEAALKAGKPTYIGRPLAHNFSEAVAILQLADDRQVRCWTSSQHRFSPGFLGMRNHPEVGQVLGADVYGGCPLVPHHADLYWHALHGIETLFTIMGPGCESVRCTSTPVAEVVTGTWKEGRVGTFRGLKTGAVKYSATVFGDKGVSISGVYGHGVPVNGVAPTNDKYMGYEGIARELGKFFKGGPLPVSHAETLEIFAFMEAAHESKRTGGAEVKLSTILEKLPKK